jgi:uncharacterized membrane protein YpjA
MALESLAFVGKIRVEGWHAAAVLAWFLINDLMDYWGGMSPNNVPYDWALAPFTALLSIASVAALYHAYTKKKPKIFKDLLFSA